MSIDITSGGFTVDEVKSVAKKAGYNPDKYDGSLAEFRKLRMAVANKLQFNITSEGWLSLTPRERQIGAWITSMPVDP